MAAGYFLALRCVKGNASGESQYSVPVPGAAPEPLIPWHEILVRCIAGNGRQLTGIGRKIQARHEYTGMGRESLLTRIQILNVDDAVPIASG